MKPFLSKSLPHQAALDGMRAVAVMAVLFNHAFAEQLPFAGGQIGVDIFFVLSGFLITSLLWGEWNSAGRVSLRNFYARRALRILPVLVLVVASSLVLVVVGGSAANKSSTVRASTQALFFFQNWDLALHQGVPLGGYLGHTWSLSIEEQFYLLWPLLLILLVRLGSITLALKASIFLTILGQSWAIVLSVSEGHNYFVYFATPTHGSLLMLGCSLALLRVLYPLVISKGLVLCAVGFLWLAIFLAPPGPLPELGAGICSAVLIAKLVQSHTLGFLRSKVALWVGHRSYGIYLWGLMLDAFIADRGVPPGWLRIAIDLPVTLLIAHASYTFVETPILSLKRHFRSAKSSPVRRGSS